MNVVGVLEPGILTTSQNKGVLREINILKEKRIRKLEGKTCAYRRPQRFYITKEDASSPSTPQLKKPHWRLNFIWVRDGTLQVQQIET